MRISFHILMASRFSWIIHLTNSTKSVKSY